MYILRYKCQLLTPLLKTALTSKCDGIRRDGLLYERVLNEVYKGIGFRTQLTGGPGDAGVDLIVEKDNKIIGIQAKNYNDAMTKKTISTAGIVSIFNHMKYNGEHRYGKFYSTRLHVNNDNIPLFRMNIIEDINHKCKWNSFERCIYGEKWLYNNLLNVNEKRLDNIAKLIDGELINKNFSGYDKIVSVNKNKIIRDEDCM